MRKIRTFKKYTLLYGLEKSKQGFLMWVEKSNDSGVEKSVYNVHGEEKELKALLCRLWKCGVTPTSFVYILEDEGYIPCQNADEETTENVDLPHIVRRNQACSNGVISEIINAIGIENQNATIGD